MPPPDPFGQRVPVGGGLWIHAARHGSGEPPLLVPGASWLDLDLEPLSRHREVVFFDLCGRGRSAAVQDEARLGIEQDLSDLEALRVSLGLTRFSLLGWSYYGLLSARYALEHPRTVDRLVLVGPSAPRRSPHFETFLDRFARRVDAGTLAEVERLRRSGARSTDPEAWCRAVHRAFFLAYLANPGHLDRMRASPCVEPNLDPDRVNNQGRRVLEKLGPYDWRDRFGGLGVPTLILHGSEDPVPLEGSREWQACLSRAELVELAGVGHLPWIENPEGFFSELERFL